MFTKVKTDKQIEDMREGGAMLTHVLAWLKTQISPGMRTKEAASLAADELKKLGGQPAFLNYRGSAGAPAFPDVICISVNEEIVHGVPGERELAEGDIVSLDFGVVHRGLVTDAATSFVLGGSDDPEVRRLMEGTARALEAGVDALRDGVRVGDISAAIEPVLKSHGLGIVRELVGHGIGQQLHEEPNIPNYGPAGTGPMLKKGMTVALEPMAMLGGDGIGIYDDGWTIVTADGSLSAHFEHTVLVTERGGEILTAEL